MRKVFSFEGTTLVMGDNEFALVREFAAIIKRDGGSKGDYDGKKKLIAFMEFAYIYFMADYRSPYIELPYKERNAKAMQAAGLHKLVDRVWKTDEVIEAAIKRYQELQDTPAIRALLHLKESLLKSEKIASVIHSQIDVYIDSIESKLGNAGNTPLEASKLIQDTEIVMNLNAKVVSLIKTVQENLLQLDKVEDRLKKEETESRKVTGGGTKYNREDPKEVAT